VKRPPPNRDACTRDSTGACTRDSTGACMCIRASVSSHRKFAVERPRVVDRRTRQTLPVKALGVCPQTSAIDQAICLLLDLRLSVSGRNELVFEPALMCDGGDTSLSFAAGLCSHLVFERHAGHEEVRQIAVESVGSTPKRLELDRVLRLAPLEVRNRLLADAQSARQLDAGHSKRFKPAD
jgi:hypothetical protein